jgi:cytochrome c-type biogenesis protein CcmH
MLLTFIVCACVLAALVVGALAWTLIRQPKSSETPADSESLKLLREQFAELESDYAAGRVGKLEYAETKAELERRVLEEADAGQGGSATGSRKGLYAAFASAVLIPVCSFMMYLQFGTPQAFDPEFLQAQKSAEHQGGHSDADMMAQIQRLEQRLRENPDNVDGWLMLARTHGAFKNFAKSSAAYEQVDRLMPGNAVILSDWADMLAAASGSLSGKPLELIERALKADPTYWKALALMGTYCYDTKDYAGAVKHWSKMREGTEPGSQEWNSITENIEQARNLGGIKAPAEEAQLKQAAKRAAAAAREAAVEGEVSLSPELAARVQPDDIVFVFARPVTGSKMPVAFLRFKASELPRAFRLDSSSQMAMGVKTLADVNQVLIEARISRSGNFMPRQGDLEGSAADPVAVGSKSVKVVISRVLD